MTMVLFNAAVAYETILKAGLITDDMHPNTINMKVKQHVLDGHVERLDSMPWAAWKHSNPKRPSLDLLPNGLKDFLWANVDRLSNPRKTGKDSIGNPRMRHIYWQSNKGYYQVLWMEAIGAGPKKLMCEHRAGRFDNYHMAILVATAFDMDTDLRFTQGMNAFLNWMIDEGESAVDKWMDKMTEKTEKTEKIGDKRKRHEEFDFLVVEDVD